MKKKHKLLLFIGIALSLANTIEAQTLAGPEVKYRRSSLHIMLIESDNFPRKETVINAYNHAPFPDKYNNHSLEILTLDPKRYPLTDQERQDAGTKPGFMSTLGTAALSAATSTNIENDGADMPLVITKFVNDHKIGNQLVAKWFNRHPDGSFDMKLIGERGQYDATEMEANIAKGTVRGTSALADAGEELISNTFVIFTKLQFISNQPGAALARDAALLKANKLPSFLQAAAIKGADMAYEKAKEGYSVWTTSFLYRLKWNDSTAAVFYNNYWMDKAHIEAKRKQAFDAANAFELEYIGSERSSALVTFSLGSQRTEDQIVELATIRNIDNVYSKLQKKYEVFKPKVPLYSGYPITAKIGRKEGLEGGERFEVLEQTVNQKTGRTEYVRKGIITVDKKSIWDNRYNAADSPDNESKDDKYPPVDRTTFKGGKDYYAGMLIREIK